jgi:branched-chain amino acid transport system permease protein
MIFACYLAIFAVSWDLLSGRTGYISFGHPFLIGIGAYTTAILTKRFDVAVEISIPIAVLVTMIGGLVVLLPALRIKGSYFALVTLAFMELMYQLVQVIRPDLTGGTRGMSGIETLTRGAVNGYYLAVTLMVVLTFAAWLLMRTRLGTALWAVGMNEESVRGSGLSSTKLKMFAFLASAFTAGIGGAFYVHYLGSIAPRALFDINFLFTILVAALIGGAGSIIGPVFGAFFLVFLLEWLRPWLPGAERYFIYGGIALVVYMYQPKGMVAILESLYSRFWRARS